MPSHFLKLAGGGECVLFPGVFGYLFFSSISSVSYIAQLILGLVCFGSLLVKRHFENPRRKWRVFGLDVAKQIIGASVGFISSFFLLFFVFFCFCRFFSSFFRV